LASERKRVLIVDDDPEIQMLVEHLLKRLGLETVVAGSATEAARILRDTTLPDLMILDMMLPEVSGVEFLRQMRMKDMFQTLPVLVLSSLSEQEQIREALDAGADRYLTKPYIGNNLVSIAQEMLRSGRRERA
jgi:two-component system, OmpR family, phosphate regulon response regulator PhoB